ncbi:synaptogenesis protein syg-2 [Trichonephila clavipes]|nr:synaptogenesis protein syg-2 [Trichonephila clavipes]
MPTKGYAIRSPVLPFSSENAVTFWFLRNVLSTNYVIHCQIPRYPPGIPEIEGYQEGDIVQVGDTLTLACITRGGNPQAELIWYRDNVQVDMSYTTSGREVTNIRTFTVDKTDNNAMYRCEASNSVTYHPRIATVKLSVHDEAHFWLNGYVNKQNCRIWSEANPQEYVETPLHPEKLTVWCALWAGGILLQKR